MIDPILLVRSISEAQAKIILALLFSRGEMTIDELEKRTGIGRKALSHACAGLADEPYCMLTRQTGRNGRAIWGTSSMLLPMVASAYFKIPGEASGLTCEIYQGENLSQVRLQAPPESENTPKNAPGEASGLTCEGFNHDDDESIDSINNDSSIINPNEKIPTCETLLKSLELLFGDTLDISDIPKGTPPKLLLAWIDKAYHDRKRINSPLGLIRARLKTKTPRSLPKDWQDRLPGAYLEEIGVNLPEPISALFSGNDQDEEPDEPELEPEESGVNHFWHLTVERLELPRSFNELISRTRAVDWDGQTMTVTAGNLMDVDLLESRLHSLAARALCGIMNCQADIKFVVGDP